MRPGPELVERHWRLLDDGVLPYTLAALRALWIAPLLALAAWMASAETRPLFGLPTSFGLLAGGVAAAQCGIFLFKGRRAAVGLALVGLAAVAAVVYSGLDFDAAGGQLPLFDGRWLGVLRAHSARAVVTAAAAAALWWWGLRSGSERVAYDSLVRNFVAGLAALLLVVAVNGAAAFMLPTSLLANLLAFVGLGLFAAALASIQEARRFESARADHPLPLARHWWSTVAAVVAALLLAALLIAWLLTPASLDGLAAAVAALLGLVGQVFSWLLLLVSYPIFWLLAWLAPLLQFDPLPQPPAQAGAGTAPAPWAGGATEAGLALSPALQAALGIAGVAAIAVLLVLAFVLAVRRYRTYAEDDVDETHESILSLDLLKAQLAELLRRRRTAGSTEQAPYVALSGDDPCTEVRRTYQALLAWAAARGLERPGATTPERFACLLSEHFPQHAAQFAVITAGYTRARYGAGPISGDSAAAVAAAWGQIIAA